MKAANAYRQVAVQTDVNSATPHRLIQMLMEGALEKIARAKGDIERRHIAGKARNIGTAISIIDGLRVSLDLEAGGEIAKNLDALYDYMGRRLFEANLHSSVQYLDEVAHLISQIKSAWDAIPEALKNMPTENPEPK